MTKYGIINMEEKKSLEAAENQSEEQKLHNYSSLFQQDDTDFNIEFGIRLREIRRSKGLTIRKLAEKSGLSANALSLIENGNSSPCLNTLRHISQGLEVPVATLFQSNKKEENIIHTRIAERSKVPAGELFFEDLSIDLTGNKMDALVVTMPEGHNSSTIPITHSGVEFVYCLEGKILYKVNNQNFLLEPGDSISFLATLPHECDNLGQGTSRYLLVITNCDNLGSTNSQHLFNQGL